MTDGISAYAGEFEGRPGRAILPRGCGVPHVREIFNFGFLMREGGGRKTEDRGRRTEDRGQRLGRAHARK